MTHLKPGDEVAIVKGRKLEGRNCVRLPDVVYTVSFVGVWHGMPFVCLVGQDSGHPCQGFAPESFRKVQKRNDRLTVEAFSVIKDGGFEEPKRDPAKTPEPVS